MRKSFGDDFTVQILQLASLKLQLIHLLLDHLRPVRPVNCSQPYYTADAMELMEAAVRIPLDGPKIEFLAKKKCPLSKKAALEEIVNFKANDNPSAFDALRKAGYQGYPSWKPSVIILRPEFAEKTISSTPP